MAHPQMFEDDDPVLARVREIARALPGAQEKVSHGRPAFFTTKVFAYYGGALKAAGAWVQHPRCVLVVPDPEDRSVLLEQERAFVPAYLGASGWIGVDLPPVGGAVERWAEIAELLDASYRRTAPLRLVGVLDERD